MKSLYCFIDFLQSIHLVSDVRFQSHFSSHGHLDKLGNFGSGFPASKSSSLPVSSSNQLERSGLDLLASCRHTNDTGLSPSSVGDLQSCPHDLHISSTVISIVVAPLLLAQQHC